MEERLLLLRELSFLVLTQFLRIEPVTHAPLKYNGAPWPPFPPV